MSAARERVIRLTKAKLKGHGDLAARGLRLPKRTAELKAQLKRAQTATVGPKRKLPNPRKKNFGVFDVVGGMQAYDYLSKKKIRNPSVSALSQKFQGRESGAVRMLKAANAAPSDLARIGKLIFLTVNGKTLKVPGAMVAASPSEKLWLAGPKAPMLSPKAKPGELLDFGPISRIVYLTAKTHIGNGQTFEYDHEFEKPLPRLRVDDEGMPIIYGGGYTIEAGGITG